MDRIVPRAKVTVLANLLTINLIGIYITSQKQITIENKTFVFLKLHYMKLTLEFFYGIKTTSLCIGKHKKIYVYYDLWKEFLNSAF